MKKIVFIFLLFVSTQMLAQQQQNKNPRPNLQGLKIAYMTKELSLSSEDAQKFWPSYFSYADELTVCKKENNEDIISYDEKALAIRKKYLNEFKNILGSQARANKVFAAEREFGNYIKQEFENRQKAKAQRLQNNIKPVQ